MAERLGERFYSNEDVKKVDFSTNTVNNRFKGEVLIVAMPWTEFHEITGMPFSLPQCNNLSMICGFSKVFMGYAY